MNNEVLALLLSKHRNEHAATPDDELSEFLLLPADKQDIVRRRLEVFDRYLALATPTYADAEDSARRMGVSIRSFYRLLAVLREKGPVKALAPHVRTRVRIDAAARELPGPAEKALRGILKRSPETTWSVILAELSRTLETLPAEAAIRRRLMAMRRELALAKNERAIFGHQILVDRIALDLPVARGQERPAYATATLLLDVETKLIAGIACLPDPDLHPSFEMADALRDFGRRAKLFSQYDLRIAASPKTVRWIVPEYLADRDFSLDRLTADFDFDIRAIEKGKFRFATETVRHIGDKLHNIKIHVRATADPSIKRGAGLSSLSSQQATTLVQRAADQWNWSILRNFEKTVDNEQRRSDFSRLGSRLVEIFADCFTGSTALGLMNDFRRRSD